MRPGLNESSNSVMICYQNIINSIIKSRGIPIGIIPTTGINYYNKSINQVNKISNSEFEEIKYELSICNGIILQGGDNFYDYDLKIVDYAYKNNIPILGICLGMQTIGSYFDGTLERNNKLHYQKGIIYVHDISIKENTKLYKIYNKKTIKVNSRHNYSLKNPKLTISSISNDNIIESIESAKNKFLIGVQWHPEDMFEYDILSRLLFKSFIDSCKE